MDNTTNPDNIEIQYFQDIRKLKLEGNPWHCDCILLLNLKELNYYDRVQYHYYENEARCATPYHLSGTLLSKLIYNIDNICKKARQAYKPVEPDATPRFLRPGALLFTIIIIVVVLIVGLLIGFGTVFIKKRLNRGERFTPPVRYTTVRESQVPTA